MLKADFYPRSFMRFTAFVSPASTRAKGVAATVAVALAMSACSGGGSGLVAHSAEDGPSVTTSVAHAATTPGVVV
jgi:hypothetical protein